MSSELACEAPAARKRGESLQDWLARVKAYDASRCPYPFTEQLVKEDLLREIDAAIRAATDGLTGSTGPGDAP